jgi:competence protein ComEC
MAQAGLIRRACQTLDPLRGAAARRPAMAAAFLLIAGILAHAWLTPSPLLWLTLVLILAAIARWQFRRAGLCSICLAAAIFLVGLTAAQLDAFFFARDQIALLTTQADRLAELQLRIDQPFRLSGGMAEMRRLPLKQIVTAQAVAVRADSGWRPLSGRINFSVQPPDNQLAPGQTIAAWGWLSRPTPPDNPGQFDFAAYDRRQRVLAAFRVRRPGTIQILRDDGPPLLLRLRQEARQLLAEGFPPSPSPAAPQSGIDNAAFLRMLLLGDRDARLNAVRDQFDLTGTAYQLSISGLHVAILAGTLLLLLRLIGVLPRRSVWIVLMFVAIYAAVALPSQSGVRALVMCGAGAAAVLSRRHIDGLQLLFVAIAAILLADPPALYSAGFQIGAVAVLGLILFDRRVGFFLSSLWNSGEIRPTPPAMPRWPLLLATAAARMAGRFLLASAVVWVTILPLVAFYFQQTNPWAVPAGFVLLPLTVVALLGAAVKILLTLVCPWLAGWWAALAAGPAMVLQHGVGWLAHLPGASVPAVAPAWWMFVCYYALLLTPLIPWRWAAAQWAARFGPALACAILFLATPPALAQATSLFAAPPPVAQVRITLLSVGAGQAALVRVRGGQTFFMDCGSDTVPDVFQRTIQPFLRQQGIQRVDAIFLSHGDYDHICAAREIIQAYGVPVVRMTPYLRPHAAGNVPAQALLHFLDTIGPPPLLTLAPDRLEMGGGVALQVLWPPPHCDMDSNNTGMVVKLICAGRSILFPADIQVPPELALLQHPQQLKSDVLVAPHHGSAEITTLAFIRAVNPRFIVSSNDRNLTHKQMAFDQIARPWPLYRTSRCGAIDVTINADGRIGVTTFTGAGPSGPVRAGAAAAAR